MNIFHGDNLINLFQFGQIDRLVNLLDNGLNPNYTRFEVGIGSEASLLRIAVSFNRPDMVKILLKKGANINTVDEYNGDLLYLAVLREYNDIIGILLSNGINYNNVDCFGSSAIDNAIIVGNKSALIMICEIIGIEKINISANLLNDIIKHYNCGVRNISKTIDCLKYLTSCNKINLSSIDTLKQVIKSSIYQLVDFILELNPRIERKERELIYYIDTKRIKNKNKIKKSVINFYKTKTSKAEAIFTNILFNYKDIPQEIKNNIVSYLY